MSAEEKVTQLRGSKASDKYKAEVAELAKALTDKGCHVTPLIYKTKAAKIKDWQSTFITSKELNYYWPPGSDFGIGLLLGTEVDEGVFLVAFDVDLDDPQLLSNVEHAVGPGSVKKKGAKGITMIARSDEAPAKKMIFREIDGKKHSAVERLGKRIQTVLPPSIHPDTGRPYEWVGPSLADAKLGDLPLVDESTWDEIRLAVEKPASQFFGINQMAWFGPGKGGTVDVTLLESSGVMVQRGWTDDRIILRTDRAIKEMLARCDPATRAEWSDTEYRRRLKSMMDDARAKGFDQPASAKKKGLPRIMAEHLVAVFGGAENLWRQPEGMVRVYKDGWWQEPDDAHISQVLLDNFPCDDTAIQNALRTFVHFAPARAGASRQRICTLNGAVNIADGELMRHDPDDLLISYLNLDYDDKAQCPVYEEFMLDTFAPPDGASDEDQILAINTFEEYVGYSLINSRQFQKFLVLQGRPGTGKSTLLQIFRFLHNFGSPLSSLSSVMFDQIGEERNRTALAGKLVNLTADLQVIDRVADGYVKMIVAGDPVPVRKLYQEPKDVEITARLVVACNDMFRTMDTSGAIERRMLLLICDNMIPEERQDRWLDKKLRKELPGIFNRIIRATQRLYERGSFHPPEYMKARMSQFSLEQNPVQQWIIDRTYEGRVLMDLSYDMPAKFRGKKAARTPSTDLYADYVEWTKNNGFKQLNSINWGTKLTNLGFRTDTMRAGDRFIKARKLNLIDLGIGKNF